jgi:hypothetical protein
MDTDSAGRCLSRTAKRAARLLQSLSEPAVSIIVTTPKLASLLQAISLPADNAAKQPGAITPERVRQALTTAESFGYWNASPEENARVGLNLLAAP